MLILIPYFFTTPAITQEPVGPARNGRKTAQASLNNVPSGQNTERGVCLSAIAAPTGFATHRTASHFRVNLRLRYPHALSYKRIKMNELINWLPPGLASLPRYVVALAIGLLMGLERERNPAA